MNETLEGKVAAITGAASGIGLACTEALVAEGARVVMIDRDEPALQAISKKLGDAVVPLVMDLLDEKDCAALLDKVLAKVDHLDILIANAGTYLAGDLVENDLSAIDRMLNLNVNVVVKNVRTVVPHMIERGTGDIVVTSSIAGHVANPWEPIYCASKWAIRAFAQAIRRQFISDGVRVATVSPGPVASALLADWPEENLRKAKESGAIIEPTEISDAVVYMLKRARTVTIRDMIVMPSAFDM